MKKTIITFLFAFTSLITFSQEFKVPEDIKLESREDFAAQEKNILSCVDWLMKTPLTEQKEKRTEANRYLMQWLTGTPDVHIEIKQEIVTFMDSPDLLMIFMGAWAKNTIETRDADNKAANNLKGIEAVMEVYTKNSGSIPKIKSIEKYVKMKEKGTLEDYIKRNSN
ncbi:MAG: hypothetical protein HOP08_17830 [Cyclobacteriaceae bacterium]|nr:hypothetical protein [Cyclobacteriaceae bacterium]